MARSVNRSVVKGICGFCSRERRIVAVWGPPDLQLGACLACDKSLSVLAEKEAELARAEQSAQKR
jgi:hypothetical protein